MDRHKHSATDSTDTALATSSRNISAISRNHATSWSNEVCSMPMLDYVSTQRHRSDLSIGCHGFSDCPFPNRHLVRLGGQN